MKLLTYEHLQRRITHILEVCNITLPGAPTGRPRKIPDLHALTLAICQHQSTRVTKKSLYEDFKTSLRCTYKTLVVSLNRMAMLAARLLVLLMRMFREDAHLVKYTDATDLPVCLKKNADTHKTMAGLAGWGHSSKGWYYGLKMTLTRDALALLPEGAKLTSKTNNHLWITL